MSWANYNDKGQMKGVLQYVPNEPIDFDKEIKIEDFEKFENPNNRLIIVGKTLYKIYKEMGLADGFETLREQ